MHIELVLGQTSVGGTERQVVRLASELRDRGHDVSVVVINDNGPLSADLDRAGVRWESVGFTGIGVSRFKWLPSRNSLRGLGRIIRFNWRRWRRESRVDVSHAFLDGAIALSPFLSPRRRGLPRRVAGIRGFRDSNRLVAPLFERTIAKVDAVVCNAPHLAREMVEEFGVPSSRVRMIPNGVDIPEGCSDVSVSPPRGVLVANFHAYKGYDDLLDALVLVRVPLTVHLCGTGALREEMRERAAALGVAERVVFVEPPADVTAELSEAQFGVHPSRTEGLSNAVLEQIAAGLPVVACDVGGNPLLVEDGVNGFLVPPGDVEALAHALTVVASDGALRERMSLASKARAELFSWEKCVEAHIDLYTDLLGVKRR
jgi:glycosyltransferase involved in cell wall biosynthesis